MNDILHWLIHTPAGLATRIAAGASIFCILAAVDLRRNGSRATRWREYAVLVAALLIAVAYGAINDQITSTISWEYFYYGKELDKILGPATPPNPTALHIQAAKIGIMATWSFGLIFGVMLLLANNPRRDLPRLRNRTLLKQLPIIVATAGGMGILLGILGYAGLLTHLSTDFEDLVRSNLFRPRRFLCAWGVHLGGYIGGALGTLIAAGRVIVWRYRLKRSNENH